MDNPAVQITASIPSSLNKRMERLAEDRNLPLDKLYAKADELLLDYMEDHEFRLDYIKQENADIITRNKEIIQQGRSMLDK